MNGEICGEPIPHEFLVILLNYWGKKYRIDGFYAQPCLLIDGILWKIMEVRRRSNGGYCLGINLCTRLV